MSDEVQIQIVDGDEDDPFVQKTDPLTSADSSEGDDGEDEQDSESDDQSTGDEGEDDEDAEYTPEELVALEELEAWREAQATAAAAAATSQLQSKYDRQFAATQRQMRDLAAAAEARELELREAVRNAQLNGLTDAEKEQLKKQWNETDKVAELDAYKEQLTGFHIDLLRTAYATEYAEFGLQADDLEQFDTPEDMEAFIKDVQIEYYKLMANPAVQGAISEGTPVAKTATAPAPVAAATRKAPAGAAAPSDAGGGSAPAPTTKFNKGTGVDAMAENIRSGWESPKVR